MESRNDVPDDWVATDADAGGLADAEARELVHGFVSKRAAAANYANMAGLVNTAGHDADFAFAGRNDAGAIRSDEAGLGRDQPSVKREPCREREFLP